MGPRARVDLDPDIQSEDANDPGSLVIGNARTGVLVDGVSALRAHGVVSASGTHVRGNRGPGMYVQTYAVAERIAFGDFRGNGALGLGVTSRGHVVSIQCEHFIGTRARALAAGGPSPLALGDGLSISEGARGDTVDIRASEFSDNARYGLVLSGVAARLIGRNVARSNVAYVNIPTGAATGDQGALGRVDTSLGLVVARGAVGTPSAPR